MISITRLPHGNGCITGAEVREAKKHGYMLLTFSAQRLRFLQFAFCRPLARNQLHVGARLWSSKTRILQRPAELSG